MSWSRAAALVAIRQRLGLLPLEMRVQVETQRVIHPRPSSLTKPLQAITLQQLATTSHMPSCHTSRTPLSHPPHK